MKTKIVVRCSIIVFVSNMILIGALLLLFYMFSQAERSNNIYENIIRIILTLPFVIILINRVVGLLLHRIVITNYSLKYNEWLVTLFYFPKVSSYFIPNRYKKRKIAIHEIDSIIIAGVKYFRELAKIEYDEELKKKLRMPSHIHSDDVKVIGVKTFDKKIYIINANEYSLKGLKKMLSFLKEKGVKVEERESIEKAERD